MEEKGIVYCAKGNPYYLEALISARRVRQIYGELPITLFADRIQPAVQGDVFDEVRPMNSANMGTSNPRGTEAAGYLMKICSMINSPYRKTIFLDTDTMVLSPCFEEIFSLLDDYDLMAAHQPWRPDCPEIPSVFPEFNTGVLGFTHQARNLLREWAASFETLKFGLPNGADQLYFLDVLYRNRRSIRMHVLPGEYNKRPHFHSKNQIYIVHSHREIFRYLSEPELRELVIFLKELLQEYPGESEFFLNVADLLRTYGKLEAAGTLCTEIAAREGNRKAVRTQRKIQIALLRKHFSFLGTYCKNFPGALSARLARINK